jgi:hypothetical protein
MFKKPNHPGPATELSYGIINALIAAAASMPGGFLKQQ